MVWLFGERTDTHTHTHCLHYGCPLIIRARMAQPKYIYMVRRRRRVWSVYTLRIYAAWDGKRAVNTHTHSHLCTYGLSGAIIVKHDGGLHANITNASNKSDGARERFNRYLVCAKFAYYCTIIV